MEHIQKSLTNPELSILSLIVERSSHGYELETIIHDRGMRNWTEIGFSSIYHVLGNLERGGLIRSRAEMVPGRGPARKVYEATEEGKRRYEREALAALAKARRSYPIFMQGLAALPLLDPSAAAEALASYRACLAERLAELIGKEGPEIPFHVAAMFSYSRTMIQAEAEWVADFEKRLRARAEKEGER